MVAGRRLLAALLAMVWPVVVAMYLPQVRAALNPVTAHVATPANKKAAAPMAVPDFSAAAGMPRPHDDALDVIIVPWKTTNHHYLGWLNSRKVDTRLREQQAIAQRSYSQLDDSAARLAPPPTRRLLWYNAFFT